MEGYRVARVGSYVTEQGEAGGGHGGGYRVAIIQEWALNRAR